MLFTIDIGNTNMVLGGFEGDKIRFLERLSTDQGKTSLEYALILKNIFEIEGVDPSEVTGAVIASVVPPLTASIKKALEKILSCMVLVVGPGLQTGMGFDVDDPSTVGTDLIVAGAAGIRDYECPLILIDMGTATTISVIDENRNFTGCMILPGLKVSLNSLTTKTSQLPAIDLDPPRCLIGKNTVDCMKSGILYGSASMLDGMIERIEEECGRKMTVVATGGLSGSIVPLCRHKGIIQDDQLLLRGLRYIYEANA